MNDLFQFALRMLPYWLLGALMFWTVWNSNFKELLKFDKKSFAKFFLFMVAISTVRYFLIKAYLAANIGASSLQAAKMLPLGGTLFVWWEDLCHSLPLVLLRRIFGTSKWALSIHILATSLIMVSFAMGHLYQGLLSAAFISLYIPWAVSFGEKKGFGTLMAGHVLYDFCTLGVVKLLIG